MSDTEDQDDEFAGRLDPPPTLRERARAVVDFLHNRPLKHPEEVERDCELSDAYEDAVRRGDQPAAQRSLAELFGPRPRRMFTPEALKRALLLRGWVFSKFVSRTPLAKALDAFHEAVRAGDSKAADRLLNEAKTAATAMCNDWDWEPFFDLLARDVDALGNGQDRTGEWPPEIVLLAGFWMGGTPEEAEHLTGLGFNREALRFGERGPVHDSLTETSQNIDAATGADSDANLLDHVLKTALYMAKSDVDVRTEPLPEVSEKVRRRQRREALAELPQAVQDRVKPRAQRKLGFDPYDPEIHDEPREQGLATSQALRDKLEAGLPYLRPAERQAVLEAWDAATQDVPLPRYWAGAYQRKIKALRRASKRVQGMDSTL